MHRLIILSSQAGYWEGAYLDGELLSEGHKLGERNHFYWLLEMAEKYAFKRSEVVDHEVNDEDELYLEYAGRFPKNLSDLSGTYE